LNKKVEEMIQQDKNDKQVREESKTRVKPGPKSTTCTPFNTSRSMSVVEGEWRVMETEIHKLKQDEQNNDSQQQPKRQKKMLKQEKTLISVTEHMNIVTRNNTTKTGRT
jgi:hypothetical protein